jgi:SAM-dependent methyltransferase
MEVTDDGRLIPERICAAVNAQNLAQITETIASRSDALCAEDARLIEAARNVCGRIREQLLAEADALVSQLQLASIPCEFDASAPELIAPQFHRFSLSIEVDNPTPAVELLKSLGYWSPLSTKDSYWEFFRRSHSDMTLTRIDDASTRLDLHWCTQSEASPWRFEPGLLLRHAGHLARAAWRRLGRLGGRPIAPAAHFLGDLLSTPRSLLSPLLGFAGVTNDDLLVDMGCGDGRVLIEAARRSGCRGVGFETQGELCKIAREQLRRAHLADHVTIHKGDAWSAPLHDATVVFLFVPVRALSAYLPQLLETLAVGTRIVAHEQVALDDTPEPDVSAPLIGDAAVTVAHRWHVR